MSLATTPRDLKIETERLVLRPVAEADLDAIVLGIGDFAVSGMLTPGSPTPTPAPTPRASSPRPAWRADATSHSPSPKPAA